MPDRREKNLLNSFSLSGGSFGWRRWRTSWSTLWPSTSLSPSPSSGPTSPTRSKDSSGDQNCRRKVIFEFDNLLLKWIFMMFMAAVYKVRVFVQFLRCYKEDVLLFVMNFISIWPKELVKHIFFSLRFTVFTVMWCFERHVQLLSYVTIEGLKCQYFKFAKINSYSYLVVQFYVLNL
jgi:hypothetical protein